MASLSEATSNEVNPSSAEKTTLHDDNPPSNNLSSTPEEGDVNAPSDESDQEAAIEKTEEIVDERDKYRKIHGVKVSSYLSLLDPSINNILQWAIVVVSILSCVFLFGIDTTAVSTSCHICARIAELNLGDFRLPMSHQIS